MKEKITFCAGPSSENSLGVPCLAIDTCAGNRPYRLLADPGRDVRTGEDNIDADNTDSFCDFSVIKDEKVDSVLLTHCHSDHNGDTFRAIAEGVLSEEASIISTPQTAEILPIQARDGRRPGCGYGDLEIHEVTNIRRRVVEKPGECEILPGLPTFWRPAGHTAGATGIAIPFASGKIGYICGDMSKHDQSIVKGIASPLESWPEEWLPDILLTTDLTYGDTSIRVPYSEEEFRLITQLSINYSRGNKTVIASFATGRGPSIIAACVKAGIPVHVDGMIRDTYEAFQARLWSELDQPLPPIGEASGIQKVNNENRRQLIESPGPWVVVTTAGMGDVGPVIEYMERLLPDPNTWFFFTSWLNPNGNGHRLVNLKAQQKIARSEGRANFFIKHRGWRYDQLRDKGKSVDFRAGIDHFHLGAHISGDEFFQFVKEIFERRGGNPLDLIVLTHGSRSSKERAALALKPFTRQIIHAEKYTTVEI